MKQKNGKYLHTETKHMSLDKTIKVWSVSSDKEIQLIKTLTQHKDKVNKVITLTCNRFASCSSSDNTIKLYNSETYEQIEIPFEKQTYPWSLLQLNRQREVLVINCCLKTNYYLRFYQSMSTLYFTWNN